MMGRNRDRIEYKTIDQIRKMRRAGLVVADALAAVREAIAPGVTTADLNDAAAAVISKAGATPSFLGYHGFPAVICASVNDEVVHGIPGSRVLAAGDVVSIDCGAIVDGWHGDSAFSMIVPTADGASSGEQFDPQDAALVADTEEAMWAGIAALATGERLNDVGIAVEAATAGKYGIVRDYVGHGIGSAMHQPPDVPNYRTRERGVRLRPGLCVAIEPMLTAGDEETDILDDDWTVVTADGSRAAHWEHTVAITDEGILVLTARDGGAAKLAPYGVKVASLD